MTAAKLYPGAARTLVDQAMRAGWTVAAGPEPSDLNAYLLSLGHPTDASVLFKARWKLKADSWLIDYAECRYTPMEGPFRADQCRIDEIAQAIAASMGEP